MLSRQGLLLIGALALGACEKGNLPTHPPGYDKGYAITQVSELKKTIAGRIEAALNCPREGYFQTVTSARRQTTSGREIKNNGRRIFVADNPECLRSTKGRSYCTLQAKRYHKGKLIKSYAVLGICATPDNEMKLREEGLKPEIKFPDQEK